MSSELMLWTGCEAIVFGSRLMREPVTRTSSTCSPSCAHDAAGVPAIAKAAIAQTMRRSRALFFIYMLNFPIFRNVIIFLIPLDRTTDF